ncbi:MAG: ATP-binding protein [Cytophagales bacterium]|nr:ATP-binding protein [Cytophagales bacterium]
MNYTYKIPCTTSNLINIRTFVGDSLKKLHVVDRESNMIVLAVDEICSNIAVHTPPRKDVDNFVELNIRLTGHDGIIVDIFDNGKPFNPSLSREFSLESLIQSKRKGGLGLELVNKIMDKVEYTVYNQLNVCRMKKRVSLQ